MTPARRASLRRLFAPRSVAFIGGRSAAYAAAQCAREGFAGAMWGVNPTRRELAGQPSVARVEDLPEAPDAVFLAVPGSEAVATVAALAERGAGGIVCYTAGFGELGAEGAALEREMIEAAGDMAFVGPNCSGMLNFVHRAALWPFDHGGGPVERGAAFISQSGMLGNTVTLNQRSLPFAYVVSSGNQAMLGVEDFIDVLVDDPAVTAIGLYVEGLNDIAAFSRAALRALENGVPVVAQKAGTSEIGARLTVTHTGSLSGTDELYQALFDRVGVIRVESAVAMLETLKVVTHAGIPRGRRIAAFTCSGGDSTMLADAGEALGATYPSFSTAAARALREALPPIATVANPLDYTTPLWGDETGVRRVLDIALADGFDAALMVQDYPSLVSHDGRAPYLADARAFMGAVRAAGIPGAVCSVLPEDLDEETRDELVAGGVAPLQGLDDAVRALVRAARFGEARAAAVGAWDSLRVPSPTPAATSTTTLDEWQGKQRLQAAGIPVPAGELVGADEAVEAACRVGFPVAVKLVAAALPHKSEAGALRLDLSSAAAVAEAVTAIRRAVQAHAPAPPTDAFLVERMVEQPVAELLVGVRHDPHFGHVLVLGSGGTLVELVRDTATLLLPTSEAAVEAAVARLKVAPLLAGFRGRPAGDGASVVKAVIAISSFVAQNRDEVVELDVNPLIVTASGAVAADVLLVLRDSDVATPQGVFA